MSYQLLISEAAESDIQDSFLWYKYRSETLSELFMRHLDEAFNVIAQNPYQFQERVSGLRVGFMKKFPYAIHYVIDNETVLVMGVFHTARDPKVWQKRIEP